MIPQSTKVWQFCNIYDTAQIGENCVIASYVEIGNNVKIGDNCKIEAYTFIPEGVELEEGVFVGPHVCFTNDKFPPSGGVHWKKTLVKKNAVIGAGSVILPGVVIGVSAIVGAGSIVTKDVEDKAIVFNESHAVRKGTHK
jgi:UDP-2-acetamido-3-amino-2,3-dideoxy-glucuronate N-acetyltransferase